MIGITEPPAVLVMNTRQKIKTQSRWCYNHCLQLEQLGNELTTDRESLRSAESLSTDLMKEKALLEKTLETLRENSERQVHTHIHNPAHTDFIW